MWEPIGFYIDHYVIVRQWTSSDVSGIQGQNFSKNHRIDSPILFLQESLFIWNFTKKTQNIIILASQSEAIGQIIF